MMQQAITPVFPNIVEAQQERHILNMYGTYVAERLEEETSKVLDYAPYLLKNKSRCSKNRVVDHTPPPL